MSKNGTKKSNVEQELRNQLETARYIYHAQIKEQLQREVDNIRMPQQVAEEHYAKAMANYDSIIDRAKAGNALEANRADMEKGLK